MQFTGSAFNLDGGLEKALARTQLRPQKTPYRINGTLLALGAYDGIREPSEATNKTFAFLQRMARHPIVHAIINTRCSQVTRFARLARGPRDTGFEVGLRDTRAPMTRAARKRQEQLQDLILCNGPLRLPNGKLQTHPETSEPGVWDGLGEEKAFGLRQSLAVETRDSMAMDWSCCRSEPSASNPERWPVMFFNPVDSAQVRRTEPTRYGSPRIDWRLDRVSFVELSPVNDREVFREYGWNTMSAMVRNPRTDWLGRGYGLAEIEIALEILLSMINGLKFQSDFYSTAHIPYGLLQFLGMPSVAGENYLSAVRQELLRAGGGADWWNIITMLFPMGPNGQSGKAEWTPFRGESTAELQFVLQYWNLLLNILCGVFQMNPQEIGFEGFSTQQNTLSDSDPASMLDHSDDKGVKPLLEAHAARRNHDIIWRTDSDFEFRFLNVESENETAKEEINSKRMARGWTPNQIADDSDEPRLRIPLETDLYDEIEQRYSEDEFDTSEEHLAKIHKVYEREAKKRGVPKFWSGTPYLPVGSDQMMQLVQAEQSVNQQALQAAQQAAMGGDGQGALGPDGQPLPPGQMPPGQMPPGQLPPGTDPNGADPNADPNADLQPHHFLQDGSDTPSPGSDPNEEESEDDQLERYKRAFKLSLAQRQAQQASSQPQGNGGARLMLNKSINSALYNRPKRPEKSVRMVRVSARGTHGNGERDG